MRWWEGREGVGVCALGLTKNLSGKGEIAFSSVGPENVLRAFSTMCVFCGFIALVFPLLACIRFPGTLPVRIWSQPDLRQICDCEFCRIQIIIQLNRIQRSVCWK